MALLKMFSKLIILVTVAHLPAAVQSSKIRTTAQRDTVAIVPKTAWKAQELRSYIYSYFKSESIGDEVSNVLKVKQF